MSFQILIIMVGKVVLSSLKEVLVSSLGSLKVYAEQGANCESAIHAIDTIYKDQSTLGYFVGGCLKWIQLNQQECLFT